MKVNLTINGRTETFDVDPGETLLTTLRSRAALAGVKQGCDYGGCGACTVISNGVTVYSCMTLTHKVGGAEVTTVEGLEGRNGISGLQKSFVEHWALQCGYCTPGILMSAKNLLDRNRKPDRDQIREALSGHVCRCTGYLQIFEAIENAKAEDL